MSTGLAACCAPAQAHQDTKNQPHLSLFSTTLNNSQLQERFKNEDHSGHFNLKNFSSINQSTRIPYIHQFQST
jgi:hypothetical protein